jgi:hypothetical protein
MKPFTAISFSLILATGLLISGCEIFCGRCYCDNYDAHALVLNDTVELRFGEAYCNADHRFMLTFDSLYGDGRCPIGMMCLWEGNARIHLTLEDKKEETSEFILNTFTGHLTDTAIHGIRYELIDLEPYPIVDVEYQQKDYIAIMLISE